jgi:hypothetical protein
MTPSLVRAYAPRVLAAAACMAAAAACGSAASSSPASPAAGTTAAAPKVSLSITVTGGPGTSAQHWTLTCDPAGGTHPDPAAACADLLQARGPFVPQPRGVLCPMILASTKVATIKGTYFGQPVSITITDGGCWLNRWAELGRVIN